MTDQKAQQKFIEMVLKFASTRKMNKVDIIGLLEISKLIIYNTNFK